MERVGSARQVLAAAKPETGNGNGGSESETPSTGIHSTGILPLDSILPGRGFYPGTLTEWLSPEHRSGVGGLLFQVAARVMQSRGDRRLGNVVIVDPVGEFFPPAADRLGMVLQRTIVVRPRNERDTFWALEQALRCRGVRVVVGCLSSIDGRVFRRLQLAAERGGGLGLFLRAARFRNHPSWAAVRLLVTPLSMGATGTEPPNSKKLVGGAGITGRRLRVELLRCHGGGGNCIELELNDETGAVRLVAELAAAEVARRATGA